MDITGFLALLQGVVRSGKGWKALCPAHPDRRRSLSVWIDAARKIAVNCHAGCKQRTIVVDTLHLQQSDLFAQGDPMPPRSGPRGRPSSSSSSRGVIVATYDYRDAEDRLLYQAVRLDPKGFYQRRPHPTQPGAWLLALGGGWYAPTRADAGTFRKLPTDAGPEAPPPDPGAVWVADLAARVVYRLADLVDVRPRVCWIVEGEKDADALWALGLPATTSVAGAGKWRPFAAAYAAQLVEAGVHVAILSPDNDDPGRAHMRDVAAALRAVGIDARWLELPGLPEKGDVSDWLAAGGDVSKLRALAETALPPDLDAAPPAGAAEPAPGVPLVPDGIGYALDDLGRLSVRRGTADRPTLDPLASFDAWIAEETVRDDGVETAIHYDIRGRTETGFLLPPVDVPAAEFRQLGWVDRAWGSAAVVYAGQSKQDHLRAAIKLRSAPLKRRAFAHTGWREIDGAWRYLHAGGAVGDPSVVVDLGPGLTRFRLPDYDPIEAKDGVRTSWRLLPTLGPMRIVAPLWACVWRAPLCQVQGAPFSVILLGQTGIAKSSLAAVALCHFGDFPDNTALPEAWLSSGAAMEDMAFRLKDFIVPQDDYLHAPGDREIEGKASRLIRAQGNLAARGRMNADLTRREPRAPRGLSLITAEAPPPGESVVARTFVIEIAPHEISLDGLTEGQRRATIRALGAAMAGYAAWLAPRIGAPAFAAQLRDRFAALREELRGPKGAVHLRVPSSAAHLLLGLELGLEYARDLDAITAGERDDVYGAARSAILGIVSGQGREIRERRPTVVFLELLQSCLLARRICFARNLTAMQEMKPPPVPVGWASDRALYLLPGDGINQVYRAIRDAGDAFPVPPPRLMHELIEASVAEAGQDGAPSRVVKASGRTLRAYVLQRDAVERAIGHEFVVPGVDAGGFDDTSNGAGGPRRHDDADDERNPF